MDEKIKLNAIESRILSELIRDSGFMTTSQVAEESQISWNTALGYLKRFHQRGWVEKQGKKVIYWKAIIQE